MRPREPKPRSRFTFSIRASPRASLRHLVPSRRSCLGAVVKALEGALGESGVARSLTLLEQEGTDELPAAY